ncbi:nucleoside triphosphate hydrolase [Caulobacter phage Seuss]|uniref:Nucleoside triphosphate hydrolase n=1 Tax=Caulobacter phage Seuss TaxID=1675601 RepID=A0A0K1LN11_9CAUD|nr:nucleoside triphosphate hydrolase [Caulobacter phage Seuss]AKU43598.1 nucleoside triphosphate hydrolase [Caulobacter phage Seuss]
MALKMRDDQLADLVFYIIQKKCMNLSDPGTGKTISVVANQYRRLQEGMKTIWCQPLSLIPKNVQEIKDWTGLTDKDIGVLDGSPAKIRRELEKQPGIVLLGPDRLKAKVAGVDDYHIYQALFDQGFRAMDTDEMHMCFGGATSARTQAFFEMSKHMEEMVHMTGTIINGRLDTAYPAIQSIDNRYYWGGYDHFLGEHAYLDDRGKPIAWHNHEKLGAILGRHGIRRTFKSIFGEQPVVPTVQWVEMCEAQRTMFEKFRKEAFLELEHFFIDGTLPGTATIRARQIQEHPNVFPDLRDPEHKLKLPPIDLMPGKRPAKEEALRIHLDEAQRKGLPLIIFAFFVPQQKQIAKLCDEMGLTWRMMNGENKATRGQADLDFKEGRAQVMIASPAVASVGFNWQFWGPQRVETEHVIFMSLSYLPNDFSQGFKRTIRGVRGVPLRLTTMAYYDSMDLRLMQILEDKSLDAHKVDPTQDVIRFNHFETMDQFGNRFGQPLRT